MEGNPDKVMNNLNAVVKRSLTWYNNVQLREFEGFSDVVKFKVQQLQEAKLTDARYNLLKSKADSLQSTDDMQAAYAKQLTGELQDMVMNEIDNYLNLDLLNCPIHSSYATQLPRDLKPYFPCSSDMVAYISAVQLMIWNTIHSLMPDFIPYRKRK